MLGYQIYLRSLVLKPTISQLRIIHANPLYWTSKSEIENKSETLHLDKENLS